MRQPFEVLFRLYGPQKPLFDKTWKLPDIEKVNIDDCWQNFNTCLTNDLVDYLACCPVLNGDLATVGKSSSDACCVVGGYWNPDAHTLTVTGIVLKKFVEPSAFIKSVWSLYDAYRYQNKIHFKLNKPTKHGSCGTPSSNPCKYSPTSSCVQVSDGSGLNDYLLPLEQAK